MHGPFLEHELTDALLQGQFVLHYQPIVNARAEIKELEALIRWQHPRLGLIPPDKFMPLLEATGLIIPVGSWVINTACEQLKIWHNLGYPELRLNINLSTQQLKDPHLSETITLALQQAELSAESLILEITESKVMENIESTIPLLKSWRNLGLGLSLDDFGTGYSSLQYLRLLPFNILKIDKSFIQEMLEVKQTAQLVLTIIAMGRNLELELIAEGIESQAQYDFLKEQGCDLFQGYFFSPALAADQIIAQLQRSSLS